MLCKRFPEGPPPNPNPPRTCTWSLYHCTPRAASMTFGALIRSSRVSKSGATRIIFFTPGGDGHGSLGTRQTGHGSRRVERDAAVELRVCSCWVVSDLQFSPVFPSFLKFSPVFSSSSCFRSPCHPFSLPPPTFCSKHTVKMSEVASAVLRPKMVAIDW